MFPLVKSLTRPDKLGTRVDSMPARIALFGKISVSARVKRFKQVLFAERITSDGITIAKLKKKRKVIQLHVRIVSVMVAIKHGVINIQRSRRLF